METTMNTTNRACTTCGQFATYSPILFAGCDLAESLPFYCQDCAAEIDQREQEAARARIKARRTDVWVKTIPAKYRETDTAHPGFNRRLWESVNHMDLHQSIALIGPSGRCKTRVFALLARRAIAQDYFVGWCPANSFQWAAQREFDKDDGPDARRWMKRWNTAPVLFLDDLGKHKWTDTVESAFFNLLETRLSNKLPTHWSMNPDPADIVSNATLTIDTAGILQRALDPSGMASMRARFAPIVSRLTDETTLIPVP